jgi:hypothetical protein
VINRRKKILHRNSKRINNGWVRPGNIQIKFPAMKSNTYTDTYIDNSFRKSTPKQKAFISLKDKTVVFLEVRNTPTKKEAVASKPKKIISGLVLLT